MQAVLTEEVTPQAQHFLAEGSRTEHFRIVQHTASLIAVRAVTTGVSRHGHGLDGIQAHLVTNNLRQFTNRQLVNELVPLGIVKGNVLHINEANPILLLMLINGDIRCVRRLFVLEILHEILDLGSSRQRSDGVGEGVPVGTGHVSNSAGDKVIDVTVLKQIGNHFAGLGRYGVGLIICFGKIDFLYLARLPLHRIPLCIKHTGHTPGSQYIVQRVMGTAADGEIIVTGVKHIAALPGIIRSIDRIAVIGSEDIIGEGQGNGFALPCCQRGGLFKVGNLDGALLRLPRLIRKLDIQLHHILGLSAVIRRTVVCHLHLSRDDMRIPIPFHAQ